MRSVIIVHQAENPTTDFYFRSRLSAQNDVRVHYFTHEQLADEAVLEGATLIIVRYLSPVWRRHITRYRNHLDQLIYFMDDDLFDWRVLLQVSGGLGWKWFRLAWRHQRWLKYMNARLCVSSPYLVNKYAHLQPSLLPPQNPYGQLSDDVDNLSVRATVFYHGTISHLREIRWLRPVIEQLLRHRQDIQVELIGHSQVRKYFQHLPQVTVVQPMSWTDYRRRIQGSTYTIGLAPLLVDRVNQARAPTKFYDITAAGAVGLYAQGDVYKSIVNDGVNGCLLSMQPDAWVDRILALLDDPQGCRSLYQNAARQCLFNQYSGFIDLD